MRSSLATYLGIFASVLWIGCSGPKVIEPVPNTSTDSVSSVDVVEHFTQGSGIYVRENCANCHGEAGEGTKRLGPPLRNLGEHWDRARLETFLLDPGKVEAEDQRLDELKSSYWGRMTAYPLAPEELSALIDYLFSL